MVLILESTQGTPAQLLWQAALPPSRDESLEKACPQGLLVPTVT